MDTSPGLPTLCHVQQDGGQQIGHTCGLHIGRDAVGTKPHVNPGWGTANPLPARPQTCLSSMALVESLVSANKVVLVTQPGGSAEGQGSATARSLLGTRQLEKQQQANNQWYMDQEAPKLSQLSSASQQGSWSMLPVLMGLLNLPAALPVPMCPGCPYPHTQSCNLPAALPAPMCQLTLSAVLAAPMGPGCLHSHTCLACNTACTHTFALTTVLPVPMSSSCLYPRPCATRMLSALTSLSCPRPCLHPCCPHTSGTATLSDFGVVYLLFGSSTGQVLVNQPPGTGIIFNQAGATAGEAMGGQHSSCQPPGWALLLAPSRQVCFSFGGDSSPCCRAGFIFVSRVEAEPAEQGTAMSGMGTWQRPDPRMPTQSKRT